MLHFVASHGFVVVAHRSCFWPWDCGPDFQWRDQARVIAWGAGENIEAATGEELRVLKMIDRNKAAGALGQSTGGRTSIQAAAAASEGSEGEDFKYLGAGCIGASVAIHPDPCIGHHDGWLHGSCDRAGDVTQVPYAVFTSLGDDTEPQGSALANYNAASSQNRAFVSLAGISHIKGTGPIWGLYAAAYFHVFLNNATAVDDYYFNIVYDGFCAAGKEKDFINDAGVLCEVTEFTRSLELRTDNRLLPSWC